jgi:propanediol dehydratase small subunit
MTAQAFSGRPAEELTLDALRREELTSDDVRIHPATLEHQAHIAESHGNPQLALNFRRAAELATIGEDEVLALYEALRPHRSTHDQLDAIAADLDGRGAPRCAALVREAAGVYARRGLLR